MNWRGRPLTSHEAVVNTIASTRTRTGLRVGAELDTSAYPTGVAVSKAQLEALPIHRHDTHGAWNYTIYPTVDPAAPATDRSGEPTAPARRAAALRMLSDPRLTGMRLQDLDRLARQLGPAQAAAREQRCYQQRGGRRRKAPGAHGRPILSDRDRVLVTVIYLRQVCSQQVLADLLEVTQAAIGPAIKETRRLLEEHRHAIAPTILRLTRAQDVVDYARTGTVATDLARSRRYEQLSNPTLTGMPCVDLDRLVDRLSIRHAALVERRRHQRRGGARLPGTRGGVFRQKITDAERILATILHLRQVCTMQALADLFDVSRRTIGNALAEVARCWKRTAFASRQRRRGSTARQTFSPPSPRKTTRRPIPNHHVESIQTHFLRNVLARVPKGSAKMVAAAIRTIFAQPTGAEVTDQVDKVAAMLAPKFPQVATMLVDATADLTAFAHFPAAHWTKIWSTNPLERLNKEIKRRTNVVGIFLRDCFPASAATSTAAGSVSGRG